MRTRATAVTSAATIEEEVEALLACLKVDMYMKCIEICICAWFDQQRCFLVLTCGSFSRAMGPFSLNLHVAMLGGHVAPAFIISLRRNVASSRRPRLRLDKDDAGSVVFMLGIEEEKGRSSHCLYCLDCCRLTGTPAIQSD